MILDFITAQSNENILTREVVFPVENAMEICIAEDTAKISLKQENKTGQIRRKMMEWGVIAEKRIKKKKLAKRGWTEHRYNADIWSKTMKSGTKRLELQIT